MKRVFQKKKAVTKAHVWGLVRSTILKTVKEGGPHLFPFLAEASQPSRLASGGSCANKPEELKNPQMEKLLAHLPTPASFSPCYLYVCTSTSLHGIVVHSGAKTQTISSEIPTTLIVSSMCLFFLGFRQLERVTGIITPTFRGIHTLPYPLLRVSVIIWHQ